MKNLYNLSIQIPPKPIITVNTKIYNENIENEYH